VSTRFIIKGGYKFWLSSIACLSLIALVCQEAVAGGGALTIGGMASTITDSFTSLTKIIQLKSQLELQLLWFSLLRPYCSYLLF
jgi:intracellular multiplication protein IcmD